MPSYLVARGGVSSRAMGWKLCGISSSGLRQGPSRVSRPDRDLSDMEKDCGIPGGVIGNTRVFGTRIPGSSPGRVVWLYAPRIGIPASEIVTYCRKVSYPYGKSK